MWVGCVVLSLLSLAHMVYCELAEREAAGSGALAGARSSRGCGLLLLVNSALDFPPVIPHPWGSAQPCEARPSNRVLHLY